MYLLRRPARQIAATTTLAALVIVPTFAIAFHAWQVHQPGHLRAHEEALSRLIGAHVTLGKVEFPRPGEWLLHDLVLRREQGGSSQPLLAELVRVPRLHVLKDSGSITLRADQMILTCSSPDALAAQLEAITFRAQPDVARINLLIAHAVWRTDRDQPAREFPVSDLAASIQTQNGDPTLTASYRWGQTHESPRCELVWGRSTTPEGPLTDVIVQFDENPAPASILQPWLTTDAWFGPDATVAGLVRFQRLASQPWTAHFEGTIESLDLGHLLATHFPSVSLSGHAEVRIQRAEWGQLPRGQGLGWTTLEGRLSAIDGSIGSRFFDSLTTDLHFRRPAAPANSPEIPYSQLALGFRLQENGQLLIEGGMVADQPREAVLIGSIDGGPAPLLFAPVAAASARGLWKVLFPSTDDVLAPATAESQILRHLPLPPAASAPLRAN